MAFNNNAPTKGICDCCTRTEIQELVARNGMNMCPHCIADEDAAIPTVQAIRAIDEAIVVKTDIFVAPTTSNSMLQAAIQHDTTIADDQKEFAYAKELMTRFQHLQQVVFEKRQEITVLENQVREQQKEVQIAVGKLREEHREQFKALDINYTPVKPKTVKSNKTPTPSLNTKAAREELNAAALKYGIEASIIKMKMSVSGNKSAEDVARKMSERMKNVATQ